SRWRAAIDSAVARRLGASGLVTRSGASSSGERVSSTSDLRVRVPLVIRGPRTILALLTALNLLNYLDRFVLPAVLKEVKQEFALSGWLAGNLATVFLIGYFATSPIFGAWSDRLGHVGRKALLALGIAVWSLATVATGLSRGVA